MEKLSFEGFKERNPQIFEGRTAEEIEQLRKVAEPFGAFMGALFEMNNKNMEEKKVGTIKNITVETGEECNVDVNVLHDTLEKLPANMYIDLFHKMQAKIYGYPAFPGWNGGCGCAAVEDKPE